MATQITDATIETIRRRVRGELQAIAARIEADPDAVYASLETAMAALEPGCGLAILGDDETLPADKSKRGEVMPQQLGTVYETSRLGEATLLPAIHLVPIPGWMILGMVWVMEQPPGKWRFEELHELEQALEDWDDCEVRVAIPPRHPLAKLEKASYETKRYGLAYQVLGPGVVQAYDPCKSHEEFAPPECRHLTEEPGWLLRLTQHYVVVCQQQDDREENRSFTLDEEDELADE